MNIFGKYLSLTVSISIIFIACKPEQSQLKRGPNAEIGKIKTSDTELKQICEKYAEDFLDADEKASEKDGKKSLNSGEISLIPLKVAAYNRCIKKERTDKTKDQEKVKNKSDSAGKSSSTRGNKKTNSSTTKKRLTTQNTEKQKNSTISSDEIEGLYDYSDYNTPTPILDSISNEEREEVREELEDVLGPAIDVVAGKDSETFTDFLTQFLHGGVGLAPGVGVHVGGDLQASIVFEIIHHDGEIGLFCSPETSLGVSGIGLGMSANVTATFIKTFGCPTLSSYEGGCLTFEITGGVGSKTVVPFLDVFSLDLGASLSLGIDPVGLTKFINNTSKDHLKEIFGKESLSKEMRLLNETFAYHLEHSEDPLRLLTFYVFVKILGEVADAVSGTEGSNSDQVSLERTLSALNFPFDWENFDYPSIAWMITRFSDELQPIADFPASKFIFDLILPNLPGCDAVSLALGISGGLYVGLSSPFGANITYSYVVRPAGGASATINVKDILNSSYLRAKNTVRSISDLRVGEAINSAIGDELSFDAERKLISFGAETLKLVNPFYLKSQCIDPMDSHPMELSSSIFDLVRKVTNAPETSNNQIPIEKK